MTFRWMIGLLAALALTFAACGDDDSAASTSPSASTSASATATARGDGDDTETPKRTSTPKRTVTPKDTEEPTDAPDDDSGETPEIDECALVTLDDLSGATGDEFTRAGEIDEEFDPDACYFDGDGGTIVEITSYNLSVEPGGAKENFEFLADLFGDEILDAPGDEAYYDDVVGLAILVDDTYELDIYVEDAEGNVLRDASFAIGEVAVANWP